MPALSVTRQPRLRARSLGIRRGRRTVVTGLDLDVGPGRIFWVTGPNGAGKSSLLRVLAGLDRPRAGEVSRCGPGPAPFLYYHPGMAVPDGSTVEDWERLVMRLLPRGTDPGRTRLWPAVEGRRPIGRLSTGESKRLLLDALLRRPGSLLLDEPYEHLSPGARADLTELLRARARSSVVVVATNQAAERVRRDGGLAIGAGRARVLLPGPAG